MAKYAVDNKDLFIEIKLSKGLGRLTRPAQQMLLTLARNVVRKKQYYDEDDRADCLQTSLVMLFANWHNYDEDRFSNAFAFFTEICKRGLASGFNQLHQKRGAEKGDYTRAISLSSANGGLGMHNI